MTHRLPVANAPRRCGECEECCTALGIAELDKPPRARCPNLAERSGGCLVYERRPAECRTFECLWLGGIFDEGARPDKLGIVFDWYELTSEKDASFLKYGVLAVESRAGAIDANLRTLLAGLARRFIQANPPRPLFVRTIDERYLQFDGETLGPVTMPHVKR